MLRPSLHEIDRLVAEVQPYTKCGPQRLAAMAEAVVHIDELGIPGDIVECGVWRGGNIILARKLSPDRVCWLYDTFDGMPRPEAVDITVSGKPAIDSYLGKKKPGGKWSAVTRDEVRANLIDTSTWDESRCVFVEGMVEETLRQDGNIPSSIALLRLDTDWYSSTKVELEVLYPHLRPGGVLIIDDYGHWQGARKAVDDYFRGSVTFRAIDYTAVMSIKP